MSGGYGTASLQSSAASGLGGAAAIVASATGPFNSQESLSGLAASKGKMATAGRMPYIPNAPHLEKSIQAIQDSL